jgi:tetratricopeptide (TPR) repeat protein
LTLIRTHFEGLNFPIPPVPPQPLLEIDRPRKLTRGRTNLLLRPHNEFIGVIGREPELSGLDAFCDNADAFRWSVLTGNGGVGKTRLALELAKRRAGSGWRAGFISAASLTSFVQHDEFPRWAPLADTLILLDYAASKTVALGRLLQQCTRWAEKASGAIRLRLVLLEREAVLESGWLHNLLNSAEGYLRDQIQDTLDSVQEISAPGGDDPDSVALRIVRATFEAWSKLSDDEAPPPLPELDQADLRGLRQRTDGKPLLLQVAALRACSERDVAGLSLWGREDLLDHTVTRERHYVERLFGAGTTRATLVERGIAFLTFTGPMPKDDQRWLSLLGKDARHLGFPNAQPGEVSADVAALLGETPNAQTPTIAPLEPDLPAEAFAVKVLSARGGLPVALLTETIKCAPPLLVWARWLRAVVDLYELPTYRIIESWLLSVLNERPWVELMMVVEGLIPIESVAFGQIAAAIGEHLLTALPTGEKADPARALILNNLGSRYSALGKHEEALAAAEGAYRVYEGLAKQDAATFEPHLALSLINMGTFYGELGRRDASVAATIQGVDINERLAKENPGAFEPSLAMSLTNLGIRYSNVGRREEALAAGARAGEIYIRLSKRSPAGAVLFAPNLAMAMLNLSTFYDRLGRKEQALQSAMLASKIYHRLQKLNADAFAPNLARSLINVGSYFSALGKQTPAVVATERATVILERLLQQRPDAFAPVLATCLNNLGSFYSTVGRQKEAIETLERAAEICEQLAERCPDAFEPDLARSLINLGNRYYEAARPQEALEVTQRANEIYQRLAKQHAEAFERDVGWSLHSLGSVNK